jgi:CheY-like chemotaxis protein
VAAPHLLLVDDSEAILAYERAVLSGLYTLTAVTNGRDALQKLITLKPDGVLLDLSMPEMSGDEVLEKMRADPELEAIPVIIVSSEKDRAEACMAKGAAAYVPKPIRADELKDVLNRVLASHRKRQQEGDWSVLPIEVGPASMALPLSCVRSVILQPAMERLHTGPAYLRDVVNLHGQPICVLDLGPPLRVQHAVSLLERKLVVIEHGELALALGVDRVHDPCDYAQEAVTVRERLVGPESKLLATGLAAVIRTPSGMIAVIEPAAFFSRRVVRDLRHILQASQQPVSDG